MSPVVRGGFVRALPRSTNLLLLSQFFGSLPIGLLLVFFPLYLHDLGLRGLQIGGIFTIAGVGSSVLLIAIGPLADRFGRRPFLLAGTAVPMAGFAIFALSSNTTWLVIASLLGGVGYSGGMGGGLVTATFNPMLAGSVRAAQRTWAMSYAEGVWVIAIGSGALLAGAPAVAAHAHLLSQLTADRVLFLGCLACSLIATVLVLPVQEQHGAEHAGSARRPAPPLRPALPHILKLTVFFALQGAGLGIAVQLLPLWFSLRYHTSAEVIAPWFALAQILGLPFIFLVPTLARRLGVTALIALVSVAGTLLLALMPFAPLMAMAGMLFALRSGFVSMQWPAQHSFLQGTTDPRLRGTATSIAMGCWSIANAALPSLSGWLLDRRLLYWPPLLGVCCYMAAFIWFWFTLRKTPLPEEMPRSEPPVPWLAESTA